MVLLPVTGECDRLSQRVHESWTACMSSFTRLGRDDCHMDPRVLKNQKQPLSKAAMAAIRRLGDKINDSFGGSLVRSRGNVQIESEGRFCS